MADPPSGADRRPGPATPRWVKTLGLVALVLIVAFIVLQIATGGDHGPGRHGHGDDPPPSVVRGDGGHTAPVQHRS